MSYLRKIEEQRYCLRSTSIFNFTVIFFMKCMVSELRAKKLKKVRISRNAQGNYVCRLQIRTLRSYATYKTAEKSPTQCSLYIKDLLQLGITGTFSVFADDITISWRD